MRRHWTTWFSLCAALAVATSAWADGVITNGVSARSLGRGGTNLGHFDNGAILHDNPGAMTNIAGNGLVDIGGTLLITDFGYSDPSNNVHDTGVCPLPSISYIRKSEDGVWAYGIGLFTPAGFSENYDMQGPFPLLGQHHYKSFGALMKVLPGLSCQVTERLSIGGTFGVGICHAELEGPYFLNGPSMLAGTPTILDAQGTGATPVWSVGMQYILSDATTVGATYTSVSNFNLDGNTSVQVPGLGASSYDSTLEVTWPQSVGIGVRHELRPGRIVSTDVIWYDWSSAFNRFDMTLANPTTPGFPPLVESLPLAWRDSVSVRLGFEQEVFSGQTFRCGYVYHRNPVPDSTLTPWIQATLEHAFSTGYGWQYNGWDIDAGYMYLFGPDRHVGTSQLAGGDFSNSTQHANIHALFLSLIRPF
jgi:long-subunit fatty acid transport protein